MGLNFSKIFFFILLVLCIPNSYGQNDTNKRYLDKVVITCDQNVKHLEFVLKNKHTQLEIINDAEIKDLAFYYRDTVDIFIKYDRQEFALKNISQYLPYPDFANTITIRLFPKSVLCIQIVQYDSRSGNEYAIALNCDIPHDTESEYNYLVISPTSDIKTGAGIYKELKH